MSNIVIVGEAYGEQEEREGRPFVGASGHLLNQCLAIAGINRSECYVTNVFNLRPKNNDVLDFCGNKAEALPGTGTLTKSKYVRAEFAPQLTRLYKEINNEDPNLIIALGSTAAWALLGVGGIKNVRGAAAQATARALSREYKVLATYHPAAVLREFSLRPILIADLSKAQRLGASRDIVRPQRNIWIEPDLADLANYERDYIIPAKQLSIDIETKGDQITCVGFAPSASSAIVIPFYSAAKPDGNYWPSLRKELAAWDYVRRWCAMHPSVFQNGMYDMHRLWRTYGIPCRLAEDDTMLCHHSLQPEMEKGLGFLATIYTDEASWKFMRKNETLKKED